METGLLLCPVIMKQLIALFFIAALSTTLLPGVLSWDQKKISLFSTVEEEQPDQDNTLKEKNDPKAVLTHDVYHLVQSVVQTAYSNIFILFNEDPFFNNQTPPPDSFC